MGRESGLGVNSSTALPYERGASSSGEGTDVALFTAGEGLLSWARLQDEVMNVRH